MSSRRSRETRSAAPAADPARRRRWRLWILVVACLVAADWLQPPQRQVTARAMIGVIDLYQQTLSRQMPSWGVKCRFQPSCSHYARAAIDRRGALLGGGLVVWRLLRCGPWTPAGTLDEPPQPILRPATPSGGGS